MFVGASDHSCRIYVDLKQMPVARPQNTQAKPRKRMIIVLMRAGSRYLEFKISGLSNLGYDERQATRTFPRHRLHVEPPEQYSRTILDCDLSIVGNPHYLRPVRLSPRLTPTNPYNYLSVRHRSFGHDTVCLRTIASGACTATVGDHITFLGKYWE